MKQWKVLLKVFKMTLKDRFMAWIGAHCSLEMARNGGKDGETEKQVMEAIAPGGAAEDWKTKQFVYTFGFKVLAEWKLELKKWESDLEVQEIERIRRLDEFIRQMKMTEREAKEALKPQRDVQKRQGNTKPLLEKRAKTT